MKTTILVPRLSSNDDTMQVLEWYINDKELIQKGDDLVLFETSKLAIDIQCESTGYILQHCREGENVSIGSPLASIYTELRELEEDLANGINLMQVNGFDKIQDDDINTKFTEAAREYIKNNNIDPRQFENLEMVTVKIIKEIIENNESAAKKG